MPSGTDRHAHCRQAQLGLPRVPHIGADVILVCGAVDLLKRKLCVGGGAGNHGQGRVGAAGGSAQEGGAVGCV